MAPCIGIALARYLRDSNARNSSNAPRAVCLQRQQLFGKRQTACEAAGVIIRRTGGIPITQLRHALGQWVVLFPLIVPACSKLSEFEKPFCFHNQSLCVFGKHLFLSKPIVHNHCYCDVGKVDDPFRCKAL